MRAAARTGSAPGSAAHPRCAGRSPCRLRKGQYIRTAVTSTLLSGAQSRVLLWPALGVYPCADLLPLFCTNCRGAVNLLAAPTRTVRLPGRCNFDAQLPATVLPDSRSTMSSSCTRSTWLYSSGSSLSCPSVFTTTLLACTGSHVDCHKYVACQHMHGSSSSRW